MGSVDGRAKNQATRKVMRTQESKKPGMTGLLIFQIVPGVCLTF